MRLDTLRDEALAIQPDTVALRRSLHQNPELGNHLPVTRQLVLDALEGLPLDITLHESTSGIAALLTGGRPGPTILLRGDMDALPLREDTGLEFASTIEGRMHACGHDTHTAMLAGAARVLCAHQDEIPGRVLFMFQPGEEGEHGALRMLEEGLLDVPPYPDGSPSPVTAAFAIHIMTTQPTGTIITRPGPMMASADRFEVHVHGAGGHASEPFRAVDPVPVAAEIVTALQTMITRRINVFNPAVITVGRLHAGTTHNIIPALAEIEGTIRTVSEETRAYVHTQIEQVATKIAEAHGTTASVEIERGYGVTMNDPTFTSFVMDTAADVLGADHVVLQEAPMMGAEDFSYVAKEVPGTMIFLGSTPEGKDPAVEPTNHSNLVIFDEDAFPYGVELYAQVALRHLGVTA
ncbi:MAG: amidohydrolase [Ilumatobacter coccineus]|uniref:Amidohydrolase n=1 Tax=Ilumatobacter coccineus TaxID=467094 RepID=A0A2G6K816_9ACTN|nr:MAG: amidohydrolase [Ilumatobacter coccineus]